MANEKKIHYSYNKVKKLYKPINSNYTYSWR